MELYFKTSYKISELVTHQYSTSFSIATRLFEEETRDAIYAIYGFVRFADEIVDTFHAYNKKLLLEAFESDYYDAIERGISLNPVLNCFQETVRRYQIPDIYVKAFLASMKSDLLKKDFEKSETDEYIYGSAEVVGLMCLKVFCKGNDALFSQLETPAMKLGSAFQKVNFLRDLKNDREKLGRSYFRDFMKQGFDDHNKLLLVSEIEADFDTAFNGLKKLPGRSKLAVLVAFYYYKKLLEKIRNTPAKKIIETRIRISNGKKMLLLIRAMIMYKFFL